MNQGVRKYKNHRYFFCGLNRSFAKFCACTKIPLYGIHSLISCIFGCLMIGHYYNLCIVFSLNSEHHPSRADLSILVEHNNDPTGMRVMGTKWGVVKTEVIITCAHLCRSTVCFLPGGRQGWDQDHKTVSTKQELATPTISNPTHLGTVRECRRRISRVPLLLSSRE